MIAAQAREPGVGFAVLRSMAVLVLTAVVIVWLSDAALSRVAVGQLPLNVLLRGVEPFRGMTTAEALVTALARSAALLVSALALAGGIGMLAAAAFALSGSRAVRAVAWSLGTVGIALPSFFWAMLLQFAVVQAYVLTGERRLPLSGFGVDEHLLLPALALAARPAAAIFRTAATALDEVRHQDHVRTARAKGLLESVVARRHIVPNAAPSMLAGFALATRGALSSLAIVEYVFTWNGAGFAFIQSVATANVGLAAAIVVAFVAAFIAIERAAHIGVRALSPGRSS